MSSITGRLSWKPIETISRRRPRCAQSGDRKPSKQRFVARSGDRNWQAGSVSLAVSAYCKSGSLADRPRQRFAASIPDVAYIRAPTLLINAQECVQRLAPRVRLFQLRRDNVRGFQNRVEGRLGSHIPARDKITATAIPAPMAKTCGCQSGRMRWGKPIARGFHS